MNITLRQLHALRAVASFGSFTRAAEHLGTTQPFLSLQVRDLEQELGVKLFDRTTRRVELTETGREFLADVNRLVDDLDAAVRSVHELAERKRGRIAVAAPPLLSAVMMPAVLAEFRAAHPGVQLLLIDVPTEGILAAVRSGTADLGVGTFSAQEKGVRRTVLVREELMLFCPRADPLVEIGAARWADLASRPLVTLTRGSGIRALVEYGFKAAGVDRQPDFEVANVATALALAEAGLGLTILPRYAGAGGRLRDLVARPLGEPTVTREIALITAHGRSLSPAAESFAATLRIHAQRSVRTVRGP